MVEYFVLANSMHSYGTRFRETGCFSISKVESFGRKSCGYNGRTVWNELPIEIRNMQRYPDFKLAIRFFIGKIDL